MTQNVLNSNIFIYFPGIPDPNPNVTSKIWVTLTVDYIREQKLEPGTEYEFLVTAKNGHEDTSGLPAYTVGATKGTYDCMHEMKYSLG